MIRHLFHRVLQTCVSVCVCLGWASEAEAAESKKRGQTPEAVDAVVRCMYR